MKKIYLLIVFCCFYFVSPATKWYSDSTGGSLTLLANWSDALFAGTTHPVTFSNPSDTFYVTLKCAMPAGNWTIAGTLIDTLTGQVSKSASGSSTINIGGSLVLYGTTIISSGLAASGSFNIYVGGDVYVLDHSRIHPPIQTNPITLHFSDLSTVATHKYITWTSDSLSRYANMVFDAGSVRELLSNINQPQQSVVGDSLNGTLICNTYYISTDSTDTFTINAGASIYTANTGGMDSSIKKMYMRHFSGKANYIYNSTLLSQVTGTTLPTVFDYPGSVTIDNPAGVGLTPQSTTFDSGANLNLETGQFTLGGNLHMNAGSNVQVDNGGFDSQPLYGALTASGHGVNVIYDNLGVNTTAFTTGNELKPVSDNTIGKLVVNKPGATITFSATQGAVIVNDSVLLQAGVLQDASTSSTNIKAMGYWANNDAPNAFVPRSGMVTFMGAGAQTIGGIYSTTFFNLTVNDAGLSIADTEYVNGTLDFVTGNLTIGSNEFIFGPSAPVAVGAGSNHIIANSTGHVEKQFTSAGAFTYPVGDATNYTPITLTISSGSFATGAEAAVNLKAVKHPNNANTTNFLKRYWSVKMSGITGVTYSADATYVAADVTGTATSMSMGEYRGALPWVKYTISTPYVLTTSPGTVSDTVADFTGISTNPPTVTVTPNKRICIPGMASASLAVTASTGDGPLTYTWAPSSSLSASTGTAVTASPTVTTTYTVTVTDGNGFTGTATTTLGVDSTPHLLGGVSTSSPVCVGDNLFLTAVTPVYVTSYSWTGPVSISSGATTAVATVNTVTTAAAGVYTVTLTNGTDSGCVATYTTTPVVVDTLPGPTVAHGGGTYCVSGVITATNAGDGIIYFEDTVRDGTAGTPISSYTVTATGTYYFRTRNSAGCWGPQDSVHVVINPLPTAYNMTGGGSYCAGAGGLPIGLENSDTGIIYRLYINGLPSADSLMGTDTALAFGTFDTAGSYNVVATNTHTGCSLDFSTVTSGTTIVINPLPFQYTLNGNGGYCLGTPGYDVMLAWGDPGVSYKLYFKDTAAGSVFTATTDSLFGTGAMSIDYGFQTTVGSYMVIATDLGTGCQNSMLDTDSIWVNPLPAVFPVSGGGTDCANGPGFSVSVDSSVTSTTYLLQYNGSAFVDSLPGNGDSLHYLNQNITGYYTVVARDTNGCFNTMAGSAYIQANALPNIQAMTPGGAYCSGSPIAYDIALFSSDTFVSYQLYYQGLPDSTPFEGSGSGALLDWGYFTGPGSYVIKATNDTSGCVTDTVGMATITVNPLPTVYTLSGGGAYCSGGAGIDLQLSGSDLPSPDPINYTILVDGVPAGVPLVGDGSSPFDLGNQTIGGTYIVIASNSTTGCTDTMLDSSVIIVNPLPTMYTVIGGGVYCGADSTHYHIRLAGSDTGISYQMYKDGVMSGAPLAGTTDTLDFGSTPTPGTYTIVATNNVTGCTNNMADSAVVTSYLRPQVFNVSGGGAYCAGSTGVPINISGTEPSVTYQLYDTTLLVGDTLTGTGFGGSFGLHTRSGRYTVIAINDSTGCTSNMTGSATVIIKPLPTLFLMAGGGSFCTGDTGRHVYLDASVSYIHYQLYRGSTLVGSPVIGTGAGLDFGLFTTSGVYTIVATDTVTGCSRNMDSSITITVNPLPSVYTVSGGGTFCSGAPGDTIFLSGSTAGIRYMLYKSGTLIDSVLGTGSAVNFGRRTAAGAYTVVAKNPFTTCLSTMTDTAHIVVNPLPAVFNVTGGGNFCFGGLGVHVYLDSSQGSGITYQLVRHDTAVGGPQVGDNGPLDFGLIPATGTFKAYALNTTTGCVDTMNNTVTINTNPLPPLDSITGGGIYCAGDTGIHVGLTGSDTGISYQLFQGTTADTTLTGTGSALDFGLQTATGTYTVLATNLITGCTDNMSGSATVSIQPYSVPVVTLTAHPGLRIPVGDMDTIVANVSGAGSTPPTYQWFLNGNPIPGATSDTFIFSIYFDNDSIVCNVTSTGLCGGVTTSKLIVVNLEASVVKQIIASNSDVRLMPNPNRGVFNLKGTLGSSDDQEVEIEVTNTLGQTVFSKKALARGGVVDERIELNGNLANGMYLLNLRSGNVNSVIHFVVEQ